MPLNSRAARRIAIIGSGFSALCLGDTGIQFDAKNVAAFECGLHQRTIAPLATVSA